MWRPCGCVVLCDARTTSLCPGWPVNQQNNLTTYLKTSAIQTDKQLSPVALARKTAIMLLDEDPATVREYETLPGLQLISCFQLIHHTIGNFNITPDKLAVSRINESLSTLQQARDLRIRESESALKSKSTLSFSEDFLLNKVELSRTLTTLNSHHLETISSHSSAAHASEIATLDTQKFRIAKSASDIEIESERLSSQLADLQARLQELELQGVEGGDNARRGLVDDEISLKLKVYRGLGIEIERDDDGEYTKAVVRSGRKGDVHVVNMDNKFSRFFYANYFWQTL